MYRFCATLTSKIGIRRKLDIRFLNHDYLCGVQSFDSYDRQLLRFVLVLIHICRALRADFKDCGFWEGTMGH